MPLLCNQAIYFDKFYKYDAPPELRQSFQTASKKFANSRSVQKSSDTFAEFKITFETENESLNFLRII